LLLEQMRGLEQRGHKVVCFTPIYEPKVCYPDWIGQFKIRTLVPQWLTWFPDGLIIQMLTSSWLIIFQFWRFFKFDVLVGIGQPGAWMAFCLSRILGKPYLVWMNQPTRFLYPRKIDHKEGLRISDKKSLSTTIINILKPLISYLDKISVSRADVLMCNSRIIARWLSRIYKRKVVQNYPGANLGFPKKDFTWQDYKKRLKGESRVKTKIIKKPFLLVSNRHFPQKRFEYAIGIMPFLIDKIPGLNLVITGGENNYTKSLKTLVYQLGLRQRVVFTGSVAEKELSRLYQQTVVYLYTAPQEDFGMGIVEAMAHGIPVVAWENAGPGEIVINGQTGFLIKPYDLVDFGKKALELLTNKKLNKKMGQAGFSRVEEKFTWKRHIDMLELKINRCKEKCSLS